MAKQAVKKQNADDGSVDNVQTTKSDVIKNTILKMALPRWSASLRGFMNIHLSDNVADDRAAESNVSKSQSGRPAASCPSDCSPNLDANATDKLT
jgi:hypothetical protein